jgi:hypothetical protein
VGIAWLLLCDRTGIDPVAAVRDKLVRNRERDPVALSRAAQRGQPRLKLAPFLKSRGMLLPNCKELYMSSMMTRGFRTFSLLALAGAAVLVFHSAAYAQQKKPGAKEADKPKAEAGQPKAEAKPAEPPKADAKEQVKAEAKDAEPAKPEAAAEAEAKPVPPPEDLPPEYGPPPGYRRRAPPPPQGYGPQYDYYYGPPAYPPPAYPPPRYYRQRPYQPAPFRYYPEPIAYRSFFFGLGLGVGGVAFFPEAGMGDNSSRAGMAYNLHFGFGVSPHWSIVLAGDGAFAYFNGYDLSQSVWSIGPQVFLNRQLYVRAGIGVATKSVDNSDSYYYDYYEGYSDSGMGWTLALGYEFMQSYHTSLGLEMGVTYGRYKDPDPITGSRNQGTFGLNFMLNLF